MKLSKQIAGLASLALLWGGTQGVIAGTTTTTTTETSSESALQTWWNGKYATGDWFGFRNTLEDHGLTLGGEWKANFLGVVDGGLQQRTGFDQEIKFRGTLDFAKLTGWEAIEGFTAYAEVRYRDGDGANKWAGSSNFAPSTLQGGKQWRFLNAYVTYTTPELFGVKEFFTLSGGWQNPTDQFIKQPESKFFLNNTITSSKGLGANGLPWGSSFNTWGGYAKIKPVAWFYLQSGLYLNGPQINNTRNHGLAFQGYHPDPDANGIFWITEAGFTPKIGPSKLPGRYAAGFIYNGLENTSFFGQNYDYKTIFYWQADQMLYREPSPEPEVLGKGPSDGKTLYTPDGKSDGKSFKETVSAEPAKLSDQGLYFFSLINFAPKFNNALPFYFQTGLIYKGLIPGRDADQLGVAFAYGNYSYYQILSDRADGDFVSPTYEGVLEVDYRIQINKWAYVQPDLQYIIRPSGTGEIENALVLGLQFGVTF